MTFIFYRWYSRYVPDSQNPITIPQETRTFLEGLLRDGGMSNLDEQTTEDMIQELFIRLDSYMTGAIIDNLDQPNVEAFIKLAESGADQNTIQEFLKDKIPNAQDIFTNAMLTFRDLYLGKVQEGREENKTAEEQPKI